MLRRFLRKIFKKQKSAGNLDPIDFWRGRAKQYGKRSVLNLAHNDEEYEAVTSQQQLLLFPLLKTQLTGSECLVLDFGCGPGRFTAGLSECINGTVIGIDIAPELLDIAPRAANVNYVCIGIESIPFPDSTFDVVWSCLVLGGIPKERITHTLSEISRVLKPEGLFFFVENTAQGVEAYHWFYRDENEYVKLTSFCSTRVIGRYDDAGQQISIFAGRKI